MNLAASPQNKKIPVILDTDIGTDIDDTWALAFLLKCPELDVKLITTASGDTFERAKIVAKILEIAGRTDIPIGLGLPLENTPCFQSITHTATHQSDPDATPATPDNIRK